MSFKDLFPENLYHSYIIESEQQDITDSLLNFLEERRITTKNNPDMLVSFCDSFDISHSEIVRDWHKNKPISEYKKICIINTKFINKDAEQTLLKVIEEPNENTHFFIIIPDSSLLLNTILSRVHIMKVGSGDDKLDLFALNFIKLNIKSRIDAVAQLIKDYKDDDSSGGLRYKAISIINSLEKIIYKEWKKDTSNSNNIFILQEFKKCRDYLSTPGASVKMILEHIALII